MSLSLKAVDRIFDRLTATYGRDFSSRWEGLDGNAVKSSWSHELSGFEHGLHMIAWALEHLPEKSPNVIEFRNLCRKAPAAEHKALEAPQADPARVAAEMAKLVQLRSTQPVSGHGMKEWAHRLAARLAAGEKLSRYQIDCMNTALGVA